MALLNDVRDHPVKDDVSHNSAEEDKQRENHSDAIRLAVRWRDPEVLRHELEMLQEMDLVEEKTVTSMPGGRLAKAFEEALLTADTDVLKAILPCLCRYSNPLALVAVWR